MTLEQAIWRLSGQPASFFGWSDRGELAPGKAADLVAFNLGRIANGRLERVADLPAGADRLIDRPEGFAQVWVGGRKVLDHDHLVDGIRPGKVLRDQ